MSIHRFAQRQDTEAARLVRLARKLGAVVHYIASPVDLLVGFRGKWLPVEIKGKSGRYTEVQREFMAQAQAAALPVLTWRDESDVLKLLE